METVTERVVAGAVFLDEHDPEWWRADVEQAIRLDTLEIRSSDSCVLGQRCPASVLAAYVNVELDGDDEDHDELSG